ncbi:MAG TPA: NirD/YgiW/YdeI family stress tolerance protein [Steroidobacteraceae bacterium]|nr:NirD/YgiW/YdeI family stress tolerance protein [Steroidobacteraceae bacterium]
MQPLRTQRMLALLIAGLVAGNAAAQYTGPGARGAASRPVGRTVAEVLRSPVDDQKVELTGTLLEQTGRETFVFSDDTGRITVEIDAEDFPAQPVGPEVRVQLSGEVETRLLREPRVEVEALRVAQEPDAARPAQPSQPEQPAQPATP